MKTIVEKKHLSELHSEITDWKNQVVFMQDELKIFQVQLADVLDKNSTVGKEVEHFQNQFVRHREVCDLLMHELKAADHEIAEKSKGNASADHILQDDHVVLRDKIKTQNSIFSELKAEFKQFVGKWL